LTVHAPLEVEKLSAWYGPLQAVKSVSFSVASKSVNALIGPSGSGKSTFLRCLNRMHEESEGCRVEGRALLLGQDIYGSSIDPVAVRRKVGMVFQKPGPFPAMTIFDNVATGLKLAGVRKKSVLSDRVEQALKQAALWEEVKDLLKKPGTSLDLGQSQRLCIARALAVEPLILLMDEPTIALDPVSTAQIEELILELKKSLTVVIATHHMQQAARISDRTAFFLSGELVEFDETSSLFTNPKQGRTEQYITGRFG
jgi:phosphate transport system ATP-binding protein